MSLVWVQIIMNRIVNYGLKLFWGSHMGSEPNEQEQDSEPKDQEQDSEPEAQEQDSEANEQEQGLQTQ